METSETWRHHSTDTHGGEEMHMYGCERFALIASGIGFFDYAETFREKVYPVSLNRYVRRQWQSFFAEIGIGFNARLVKLSCPLSFQILIARTISRVLATIILRSLAGGIFGSCVTLQ